MPRTGRPKKENSNTIRLDVKINSSTKEKLDKYCEENNISKGEAVRKAIDNLVMRK